MTNDLKHLRRATLDRAFSKLRKHLVPLPRHGWIHEIRTLLGMTTSQLAKRIGSSQSSVSLFEKSELRKSITLGSLEKLAAALECEVHYVLLPKRGLESELLCRATEIYEKEEHALEHHMQLENQGTTGRNDVRRAYEILRLYKKVWNEP